jgi:ankyrin repeat protein
MNSIDEELLEAAEEINLPEVRRLLRAGADVNAVADDFFGNTALHKASDRGHVQVVKELLGHGADVNVKDNNIWTPLHFACWKGHAQVFKELVDHGADIEAKDNDGRTPLHCACLTGHVAVVNELVSPNDRNDTTIILGKRKSRAGANIEVKTNQGNTPLHIASLKGHLAIIKALLTFGADILAVNNDGRLPVHCAVSEGKSAASKYLLQHFYATRHLPLHELLEDLTWIGDPNSRGAPPLRRAFHRNLLRTDDVVEIVEYLVGRNPSLLSSRDQDGSLPLHLACRRGASFTIVQSLVNLYKASVKSRTPQGDLPLFLACEILEPSLDSIFLLIKLYPEVVYR